MGGGSSAPANSSRKSKNSNRNNNAELSEAQESFSAVVGFGCQLISSDFVMKHASPDVLELRLDQSLPPSINLFNIMQKLPNLQKLDISGNQLGPVGLRCIFLAMCTNSTITSLIIADNQSDTDTAEQVGQMLGQNKTLKYLDLSGNYLGKDYFSRCVGPAMAVNESLQILKCEGIGSTDLNVFSENLLKNKTLATLNLNNNEVANNGSFTQNVTNLLKMEDCCLKTLELKNCGLKSSDVTALTAAFSQNSSLESIDVCGAQAKDSAELMDFVVSCLKHKTMSALIADDIKLASTGAWNPASGSEAIVSSMKTLSLISCGLTDDHFSKLLAHLGQGSLKNLQELLIGSNPDLSGETMKVIMTLTMIESSDGTPAHSSLTKLNLSTNNAESMLPQLSPELYPKLAYINLRRAKISEAALQNALTVFKTPGLDPTFVLDGLKISGSGMTKNLFDQQRCNLVALSMSNSQLDDEDAKSIFTMCAAGTPLHMLKLSGNRLTSASIDALCEALEKSKLSPHPMNLIDFSNNQIDAAGATRLATSIQKKKVKLQSVNLSNNVIDTSGLVSLTACVAKTSLFSLNLSGQQESFEEEDMKQVFESLAKALGLKIIEQNEEIQINNNDIPKAALGCSVKLKELGGLPSNLGKVMDCQAIQTDRGKTHLPNLMLHNALEIAAALKGLDSLPYVVSKEEFDKIISATKDAPSWLQIGNQRDRAVYMTSLPGAITTQKIEAVLENEADCSVDEVYLLKDLITRKNNGNAWVLLSDEASVARAVDLFNREEALVFSQPFSISRVQIKVDDEANSEAEAKARSDVERRQREKRQEASAHQQLIERSYHESQARHAYRLAHPAYADGRIW